MASIQDLIHRFEEKSGQGLRLLFVVLMTLGLLVCYNWRCYRNFGTQEAMDAAQVARNLAEGRGFSTQFIRPFSLYLVQQHNKGRLQETPDNPRPDYAQLKGEHPDLANPPVYPVVLAAAMKVLPFDFTVNTTKPFWSEGARVFRRYQPDFLISLGNQILLIVVAVLAFFLARRLFDASVAWLTYVLIIGCEFLWRFSTTGISTMLLLVWFMMLLWLLVWIESEEREPVWSHRAQLWLALGIGLTLGVGTLTRYAFGWLVVPVLVYLALVCVLRRWQVFAAAFGTFLLVLTPWLWRNFEVSGTPFGTAGYALVETTFTLPEYRLQRALEPDFRGVGLTTLAFKFFGNLREILQNDLPRLGGSWVVAFFAVGLLLTYRSLALRRLRYFVLAALGVLTLVQALGQTQLSVDSPIFNTEYLLVLLVPIVFIYGAGLFFQLLDQMNLKVRELRYLVVLVMGLLGCMPMLFIFVNPKLRTTQDPLYLPQIIQRFGNYMKPIELTMSDIPWAMAWYGNRQCLWVTANSEADFYAVHDFMKPVRLLYLTPQTTDSRFLSQWIMAGEKTWPKFVLEFLVRSRAPEKFPMLYSPKGYMPQQLILSDWERWKGDESEANSPAESETAATPSGKDNPTAKPSP